MRSPLTYLKKWEKKNKSTNQFTQKITIATGTNYKEDNKKIDIVPQSILIS